MNPKPSGKTAYVTVGTAIVTILAYVLTLSTGVELPIVVHDAAVILVVFALCTFIPAKSGTFVNAPLQGDDLIEDTSEANGATDFPDPGQDLFEEEA